MCEKGVFRICIIIAIPLFAAAKACERMTSTTLARGIFSVSDDKAVEGNGKIQTDGKVIEITASMNAGQFIVKKFKARTTKCSRIEFFCRDPDKNVLYKITKPLTGITGGHYTIIDGDFTGCSDVQVKFINEARGKQKPKMVVKAITMRSCLITDCEAITPDELYNPNLQMLAPSKWEIGACVSFSCNSTTVLFGENVTCCGADGEWNNPIPYCATVLPPSDDYYTTDPLPTPFMFLGNEYDTAYVSNEGYITIGSGSVLQFINVMYSDVDTRISGTVSYRFVTEGPVINDINNEIVSRINPEFAGAEWALIADYDKVPLRGSAHLENTYTVILAARESQSFVIYDYAELEYKGAVNFVGVGIDYWLHPYSFEPEVLNLQGTSLIFQVDTTIVTE